MQHQKTVHLTLSGKGGLGKSFVTSLIAQGFHRAGRANEIVCIDADPVNPTFAQYTALGAEPLPLMRGDLVDQEKFDVLLNRAMAEDKHFVVDNGASSFIPMLSYLIQMSAVESLTQAGKRVIVHVVLNGGGALGDSLQGLKLVAEKIPPAAELVVWLNEHQGPVVSQSGKPFEEMPIYQEYKDRITHVVRIPQAQSDMFARAVQGLIADKLTFDQAVNHPSVDFAKRQRLNQIARPIFEQVEKVIA
jgi:hypothetical protein